MIQRGHNRSARVFAVSYKRGSEGGGSLLEYLKAIDRGNSRAEVTPSDEAACLSLLLLLCMYSARAATVQ